MSGVLLAALLQVSLGGLEVSQAQAHPGWEGLPLAPPTAAEVTVGELQLQIFDTRQQRDAVHMHWVAPLSIIGGGLLLVAVGAVAVAINTGQSTMEGAAGEAVFIGAGVLLVIPIGLLWLGIDALVYAVRRGSLNGELRALESQLAQQISGAPAIPASPGFALARF